MGLLSNRVDRKSLKPGDHIYSWRTAFIYAHHGIYVGDEKVIHFTGHGKGVGTRTAKLVRLCPTCTTPKKGDGVVSSCLKCFLSGGRLYRFEYRVSSASYLAQRGGTCTTAESDPDDDVIHRATYLLDNGFSCYNVFTNNCESFAIYCKTGLVALNPEIGQSGQAACFAAGPVAAILCASLGFMTTNVYGIAGVCAVGLAAYYGSDIGNRKDIVKMSVETLTRIWRSDNDAEAPVSDSFTQQEQPTVEALKTCVEIERGAALDSSSPPMPTTEVKMAPNTIDMEDVELWSSEMEKLLIDIMVDEVNKENMQNGIFLIENWTNIVNTLSVRSTRTYAVKQVWKKYQRLKIKHREFSQLLQHTGFDWEAKTNTVSALEETWQNHLQIHPNAAQFRKKGCEHYKLLEIIFNKSTATGVLHHASTQSPPNNDDGRELEDEYLNVGVHIDVDASKAGIEVSLAMAERDSSRSRSIETINSSITSVDFSLPRCVAVLDELEDIDDNTYVKALGKFTNPDWREIFISLSTNRKRAWLNRLV